MTSPAFTAPQFQVLAGRISNLDRCNRCGSQRAAHGADWGCPQRLPAGVFLLACGFIFTEDHL